MRNATEGRHLTLNEWSPKCQKLRLERSITQKYHPEPLSSLFFSQLESGSLMCEHEHGLQDMVGWVMKLTLDVGEVRSCSSGFLAGENGACEPWSRQPRPAINHQQLHALWKILRSSCKSCCSSTGCRCYICSDKEKWLRPALQEEAYAPLLSAHCDVHPGGQKSPFN